MLYPPTIDTSANDDEGSSDPSEEDDVGRCFRKIFIVCLCINY